MPEIKGRIVQILGGVVDVEFPVNQLPEIYEALTVNRKDQKPLTLEVQKHLGNNWVRCVAMDTTDGLQRGLPVQATGSPILVPVGPATLGRIFNVLVSLWIMAGFYRGLLLPNPPPSSQVC